MTHQIESADIQAVYPNSSKHVITSRIPTMTYEEITQSLVVMNKILEIFQEILTENDKQLITNILDTLKKDIETLQTRYIITSRIPTVTYEEITQSLVVVSKIIDIFREVLTENDKQLIINILDSSKKVILTKDQLIDLLVTVLSINSGGVAVSWDDVTINYSEDILSTCLKVSASPFKNIVLIKVFEQELGQVQPGIYSALASTFKISIETFYQPVSDTDVCC